VDVTGIEPVTPCLQSIGLDSIRSIRYCQLITFPTNRGACFSLRDIPNCITRLDSCTVCAQWLSPCLETPSLNRADFQSPMVCKCAPKGLFRSRGNEYTDST